ncbi:translation initiation factor eIF 4e-like domain-containing protein [Syncephalastrum racemosum]|uniref:Translation initiation factor eIF 4e-like domain-containing protein n=1 Tax=Syncephalastrum racemosum TaxID=13706 RepID=A0A1X2H5Y5_SYNRA|nr:translation initiation factor eIF 4e-like domain-containing protein [Syncephalastrum racemosum]
MTATEEDDAISSRPSHSKASPPTAADRAPLALSPAVSAFQFRPNHLTSTPASSSATATASATTTTTATIATTTTTTLTGTAGAHSKLKTLITTGKAEAHPGPDNARSSDPVLNLRRVVADNQVRAHQPSVSHVQPLHIKDGYVYKDEVIILDEEQKEQLLKVGEITLQSEWTFWYDRYVPKLSAAEYEANLQVISTVGTVQKFWSVYNNIDGPDRLGFRSNLHFMRKGIKPIWEDPQNEHGGSYNFKIPKIHSPLAWRDILVLLIGERVEEWLGDNVCGVSVSSRQQCDNYQIWTAHTYSNSTLDAQIRSKLIELLKPAEIQSFYYKVHKNHAAFQKDQYSNGQQQQQQQQLPRAHRWTDSTAHSSVLRGPLDMRQKITEQNIEKVVADIERLGLKQKEKRHTQQQQQQQQQQPEPQQLPQQHHHTSATTTSSP